MLVSIIIPVYNLENYVARTIQSVLAQTYKDIEIIVVDDGSTDSTCQVISKLAEANPIIHLYSKTNGGVSSARLYGIEKANGQYIGFVDGDDTIEPDMVATLVDNAKKYNADISHCGYKKINGDKIEYYYNTENILVCDNKHGVFNLVEGKMFEPSLNNKLYRKSLFDNIEKNIDLTVKLFEDLMMNYYLFKKASSSVYYDACLYNYIVRDNSACTSSLTEHKLYDVVKILKMIKNDTDDNEIKRVTSERIAFRLIDASIVDTKKYPELYEIKEKALAELKELRPEIINGNHPKKVKLCTSFCCFSNKLYGLIHSIYRVIK